MPAPPAISAPRAADFAAAVVRWQKKHGRRNLPWRADGDPYKIWLSEVMLQQTRAAAVIPYYQKFVRRWPDAASLARARPDSVMAAWSGLGYYARARNLHFAAKIFRRDGFPQTAARWREIPGVGRSTAAAIAVFSRGERAAILDGNVKRVLARAFAVRTATNTPAGEKELWAVAETLPPPSRDIRAYTQGMMDLGATVCVRASPKCGVCPLSSFCVARRRGLENTLPHRISRGRTPLKNVAMALLLHQGRVFLEKRPPSGIWGGLRSLPENESAAALKKECGARLRCEFILRDTGEFSHAFTHFRLRAKVLVWECAAAPAFSDGDGAWYERRALPRAALPSPIKKFLQSLE
ncbi:MAG: A/G-specific adenine glycosylase [Gammaproteobacteria bacterium]